jgi:hypothetical protein
VGTAKKPKAEVEPPSSEPIEIVVRRGALRRFDQLKQKSAGLPVQLTWDRRVNARRRAAEPVASERRRGDRRQAAPFTWEAADFVVVGDQARNGRTTDAAPKRKRG